MRGLPEFAGELPVSVLCEEITTPGEGQIRALITSAGNPVLSTPDGNALDKALGSLEFMVSIDVYINESTRHADLILPPASFLTQDHYDSVFNAFAVRRVARLISRCSDAPTTNAPTGKSSTASAPRLPRPAASHGRPCRRRRRLIAMGLARGDSGLSMHDLEAAEHGIDLGPLRPSLLAAPGNRQRQH